MSDDQANRITITEFENIIKRDNSFRNSLKLLFSAYLNKAGEYEKIVEAAIHIEDKFRSKNLTSA